MASKKKPAKTKRDPQKTIADAKKALTRIQKDLELELTKIKRYTRAMDEHNWFRFD